MQTSTLIPEPYTVPGKKWPYEGFMNHQESGTSWSFIKANDSSHAKHLYHIHPYPMIQSIEYAIQDIGSELKTSFHTIT